jgi:hypothetical protein
MKNFLQDFSSKLSDIMIPMLIFLVPPFLLVVSIGAALEFLQWLGWVAIK